MTPEEKAGQITQYFDFLNVDAEARRVETEVAAARAGSLLFITDPVQLNRLQHVAMDKTRLKIPLIFGFDVIHGLRTILPVPIAMAASWEPRVAETGQAMAAGEARAVGLHWAFSPMVDIARDPRWGRMVEGRGRSLSGLGDGRSSGARVSGGLYRRTGPYHRGAQAFCRLWRGAGRARL
jgi:beta-glucosidase